MAEKQTLLVELLTEELPPKALKALGLSFASSIFDELAALGLVAKTQSYQDDLATPRRLAVLIPGVADRAASETKEVQGPSVSAPAQAVAGFAKKQGIAVEALERRATPKGEVFVARVQAGGATLDAALAGLVEKAVKKLPIPKVMRWGSGDAQFVRPVHGLVMLHGGRVVPGTVLGLPSGKETLGHRFLSAGKVALAAADDYEKALEKASVVASFGKRRSEIEKQLQAKAKELGGSLGTPDDVARLVDEVTALVELPEVYAGAFDAGFLQVPQECLILTMRQNQKYFPLFDAKGKLLARFLIVSNMKMADARHVIGGNERVVRPRLEDARFFYQQDRKMRLEARVPQLGKVVYHAKLGSVLERVQRVQLLAGAIARQLKADVASAERAAWLAKADLVTGMVGEFPELQGVMGRYYALHDGEQQEVANAIEMHYWPRFAGDQLPEGDAACSVALADKLDALAGMFGIGQQPTGEKDPFGLRRAALGVVRILVERDLPLELPELLKAAFAGFGGRVRDARAELEIFAFERARGYFQERSYSANEVEAVLCLNPSRFNLIPRQLEAVRVFSALPEADSLAAANKRIGNILKQANGAGQTFDSSLLVLPEEKALAKAFESMKAGVEKAYAALEYAQALKSLASLKAPVDAFFDKVMVMDKDERVRANRIGLLRSLSTTMNRIADLSKLAK